MSMIMKQMVTEQAQIVLQSENLKSHVSKGTSGLGLQKGWTRVTFIVKEEHAQKIKMHAKTNKITMKKVLNVILTNYLSSKAVDPIPQK